MICINNKCLTFNSKIDLIAIMKKGSKVSSKMTECPILRCLPRPQVRQKSRIAFIINEYGQFSLFREIGDCNHKLNLAVWLEREAAILKAEAFTEQGLGACSAA